LQASQERFYSRRFYFVCDANVKPSRNSFKAFSMMQFGFAKSTHRASDHHRRRLADSANQNSLLYLHTNYEQPRELEGGARTKASEEF
jgi:hypothetical protein